MTTLQKTLVTTTLAMVVGSGIYEARQAAQLRGQVQTLERKHAPQVEQIQQLTRERDDLSALLASLRDGNQTLKNDASELLRLRGRVAALQEAGRENARLSAERDALAKQIEAASARLPEDDPDFQMRRDKMRYLSLWAVALKLYARTNSGLLPKSLAEAAPYMPNSNQFFSSFDGKLQDDQFEMVCQVPLTNLGNPTGIIVSREKESVRASNGKWYRTYLFADGHTEIHYAADGDFASWERQRQSAQP